MWKMKKKEYLSSKTFWKKTLFGMKFGSDNLFYIHIWFQRYIDVTIDVTFYL